MTLNSVASFYPYKKLESFGGFFENPGADKSCILKNQNLPQEDFCYKATISRIQKLILGTLFLTVGTALCQSFVFKQSPLTAMLETPLFQTVKAPVIIEKKIKELPLNLVPLKNTSIEMLEDACEENLEEMGLGSFDLKIEEDNLDGDLESRSKKEAMQDSALSLSALVISMLTGMGIRKSCRFTPSIL